MKRILITLLTILLFAGLSHAAGTCTDPSMFLGHLDGPKTSNVRVQVDCTADAADGSYPDTTIGNVGGYLMSVDFDPGTVTVPTTGIDMTVELGSTGIDLLGGAGADIVTSADALITPLVGAVSAPKSFTGNLIVKFSGNTENSATLTYYLNIDRGN